jgi:chemotaxis protein CheZ
MADSKNKNGTDSGPDFEVALRDQAASLKDLVDAGKFSDALQVISALNETRDKSLFQEVGRLTRSLHEAIRNFQIDTVGAESPHKDEFSKMGDASDRLTYVVDMTNKAANKTMDLVEESMPIASEIKEEAEILKADWARLRRREMEPDEFRELYKRMDVFLDKMTVQSDKVYRNLSDILMAQDFQDLTGQVIQKVTSLVKEVEENLVKLVRMAGKVDQITGTEHKFEQKETDMSKGEGPQMNAEVREDVVSGQDDVDDLLSSLGF